jgi:hypothetical protein
VPPPTANSPSPSTRRLLHLQASDQLPPLAGCKGASLDLVL